MFVNNEMRHVIVAVGIAAGALAGQDASAAEPFGRP
jgi:hypothetical protein